MFASLTIKVAPKALLMFASLTIKGCQRALLMFASLTIKVASCGHTDLRSFYFKMDTEKTEYYEYTDLLKTLFLQFLGKAY